MELNNYIDFENLFSMISGNEWFIPIIASLVASLAAVGILAVLSYLVQSIRKIRNPHSGVYLLVTKAFHQNTYIVELLKLHVAKGDLSGKIETQFQMTETHTNNFKYTNISSTFDIGGKLSQRVIVLHFDSLEKSQRDIGSFIVTIDDSGHSCRGYWAGISNREVRHRPTLWLKVNHNKSDDIDGTDFKSMAKNMISALDSQLLITGNGVFRFENSEDAESVPTVDFSGNARRMGYIFDQISRFKPPANNTDDKNETKS